MIKNDVKKDDNGNSNNMYMIYYIVNII